MRRQHLYLHTLLAFALERLFAPWSEAFTEDKNYSKKIMGLSSDPRLFLLRTEKIIEARQKSRLATRNSGLRLQDFHATHVRAQHVRHDHAAIFLLVVFQHGNQRAAHGQA